MAIIMIMDMPGVTQAQYEEASDKLTGGKGVPRSPGDLPVPGLITHAAGPTENGWVVVDVWESQEAFEKFGEIMMPLTADWGSSGGKPQIYPAFNTIS